MGISATRLQLWNRALSRIGETEPLDREDDDREAAALCRLHYDDLLGEVLESHPWPWAIRQSALTNIDSQSITTAGDGATTDFSIPYAFRNPSNLSVVRIGANGVAHNLVAVTDYTLTPAADGVAAFVTLLSTPGVGASVVITVTTSRAGWLHVYPLPSDCVTPIGFLYQNARFSQLPYRARLEFAVMPNEAGDGYLLCANVAETDFDAFEYVALIDYVPMMPRSFVDALVWRLAAELATGVKKDPKLNISCMQMYEHAVDEASAQTQNIGQDSAEAITPSLEARG